jgi:hypothetical protein
MKNEKTNQNLLKMQKKGKKKGRNGIYVNLRNFTKIIVPVIQNVEEH